MFLVQSCLGAESLTYILKRLKAENMFWVKTEKHITGIIVFPISQRLHLSEFDLMEINLKSRICCDCSVLPFSFPQNINEASGQNTVCGEILIYVSWGIERSIE